MEEEILFLVPFEDYIKSNKKLWSVGFMKYGITIISDNEYIFSHDEEQGSGCGDIRAKITIKNNKIILKGKGSRNFKSEIIKAYNWYIKALKDDRYYQLFV